MWGAIMGGAATVTAMPRVLRRRGILLAGLLLTGCAVEGQNADQRGFFGGIGAAVSGADERNVQRLEYTARQTELEARLAQRRQQDAVLAAEASGRQVTAAERRLAALQRDIARQRATVAQLRREAQAGTPRAAEANRLEQELDALDRERRAAAGRAGDAEVQRLEERSRAINEDVRRFGAM